MNFINFVMTKVNYFNKENELSFKSDLEGKVESAALATLDESLPQESTKKLSPQNTCNLEALRQIANAVGGETKLAVEALEKTGRLNCNHFIPWKDQYPQGGTGYIDGIKPEDLDQSVKWGIDPWSRVFIGLRCTADDEKEESAAVFQRYTTNDMMVKGNHYGPSFNSMGTTGEGLSQNLEKLLKDGKVNLASPYSREKVVLTLSTPEHSNGTDLC